MGATHWDIYNGAAEMGGREAQDILSRRIVELDGCHIFCYKREPIIERTIDCGFHEDSHRSCRMHARIILLFAEHQRGAMGGIG